MNKLYSRLFSTAFLLFLVLVSYAQIPSGYYYPAYGKKGAELKTALHLIIREAHMLAYGAGPGATWDGFSHTDRRDDGSVYDMYSDIHREFDGTNGVNGMHIEHSLPNSWWGGIHNNAFNDLHHLYPADATINISKSNNPLGIVTGKPLQDNGVSKTGKNGFGTVYTGNCFEPADEYKGDFARSYLYMVTAYEDFAPIWNSPMIIPNSTYPVWEKWAIDLLMSWDKKDIVSDKELKRTEEVYKIQGNRNPFIDYPELVDYIWGDKTDQVFPFPEITEPTIITPRTGKEIDFGLLLKGNSKQLSLDIQALCLTSPLHLEWKNATERLSLSKNEIPVNEASAGTSVVITYSAVEDGYNTDTLLISSDGIATPVMVKIQSGCSSDFMVLPVEKISATDATLTWMNHPEATQYSVDVYQGNLQSGDLMISSYIEGSSNNKAIEIYNGTGEDVNLSKYSLRKQTNGDGEFLAEYKMTGILADGQSYLLVAANCSNEALLSQSDVLVPSTNSSPLSFNGNDAVGLYHNGILIDMVGIVDGGNDNYWGQDVTLTRKQEITMPSIKYIESEWDSYPVDYFDAIGTHKITFDQDQHFILQGSKSVSNQINIKNLEPLQQYSFKVSAITPSGNILSENSVRFTTSPLSAPEALEATGIASDSFKANWDPTPETDEYRIDLFTLTGNGEKTDEYDFNTVVNGKPLPEGWTGTVSGSYTSTTNSGKSPNSLGFKNDTEYIQSTEYASPISKLSFFYGFVSAGEGSHFTVELLKNNAWTLVETVQYETGKKTWEQSFTEEENVKAFRITYYKTKGNFFIDDVSVTYGNSQLNYIVEKLPVTGNNYSFTGLNEKTTYYYRVFAASGDLLSEASETISVTTTDASGIETDILGNSVIYTYGGNIIIDGLQGNEHITIFNLSGNLITNISAGNIQVKYTVNTPGIYLVRIQSGKQCITRKVAISGIN
ncbi:endonuclease [Coprobacter tertius]|uniref:Endonuclease n=1 Tax=Coprobacter tertius TaxID=2944915 RepID=A0ABT1MG25_9BACT|nr:endonuclease [Coprobacter tertius]MCP9611597.1 endonuclease [Coprobacter tertius]